MSVSVCLTLCVAACVTVVLCICHSILARLMYMYSEQYTVVSIYVLTIHVLRVAIAQSMGCEMHSHKCLARYPLADIHIARHRSFNTSEDQFAI